MKVCSAPGSPRAFSRLRSSLADRLSTRGGRGAMARRPIGEPLPGEPVSVGASGKDHASEAHDRASRVFRAVGARAVAFAWPDMSARRSVSRNRSHELAGEHAPSFETDGRARSRQRRRHRPPTCAARPGAQVRRLTGAYRRRSDARLSGRVERLEWRNEDLQAANAAPASPTRDAQRDRRSASD